MKYTILGNQNDIAFVKSDKLLIRDTQSALDLILSAKYETGCEKLILNKACLPDDFFVLSTGLAGEIIQKFVNYKIRIAIVGEYSKYTSKSLGDFIYESNKGSDINFLTSLEEAVKRLEEE